MKIVFFASHLKGTDGWSRYAFDLARNIKNSGHEVLCLVSEPSVSGLKERVVLASPLRYLANPFLSWQTAQKINLVLSEFQPDIIHFIAEPYAAVLPFLSDKTIPSVITIHGSYAYPAQILNHPLKRLICRITTQKIYRTVDFIIAVSHFTSQHLLANFSPSARQSLSRKIKIIGNGLDMTTFPPLARPEQATDKTKQIIFVGSVKSGKGLREALLGLSHYQKNFSADFVFNIIGNYNQGDHYYLALQKNIQQLSLSEKVFFRGRVGESELLNFYRAADLFLMPSLNIGNKWLEGFGLVYLEAASQGVPCIGSTESGAPDAIIDGRTGYLINARNPLEMAEKIDLVLNHHPIKSEDCLAWARKNDIKIKVKEVIELYRKLMDE